MNEIRQNLPFKMSVSDLIEKHANTKNLEYRYDLADYIIDNTKKETLKERYTSSIPIKEIRQCG